MNIQQTLIAQFQQFGQAYGTDVYGCGQYQVSGCQPATTPAGSAPSTTTTTTTTTTAAQSAVGTPNTGEAGLMGASYQVIIPVALIAAVFIASIALLITRLIQKARS